jgi:ADP-heptose:LPS heptosyltransferase
MMDGQGKNVKKILIIALAGIGDLILFLPVMSSLRKAMPQARIDGIFYDNGSADLYVSDDLIQHPLFFPLFKWEKRRTPFLKKLISLIQAVFRVRKEKYDLALWPFAVTTTKKVLLMWLFGAKQGIIHAGSVWLTRKSFSRRLKLVPFSDNDHVIQRNAGLVKSLGIQDGTPQRFLELTHDELTFGRTFVESQATSQKLRIGFHPGGNLTWNAYRQWPPEKFASVVAKMSIEQNAACFLFGTEDERSFLEQIANQAGIECCIVCGMPLRKVASIISALALLVGNDSALCHLASAVGVKTLSIIGPTNYNRTGPWGDSGYVVRLDLPCSPCFDVDYPPLCKHHYCLKNLEAHQVYQTIMSILHPDGSEGENKGKRVYALPSDVVQTNEYKQFLEHRFEWEKRFRRIPATA